MRFIPTNCLTAGMELARTVYYKTDVPYLVEGTRLTEVFINSIKKHEFSGLYINDDISKDIQVINVISDKLRNETMGSVKKLFIVDEKNPRAKSIASKKVEIETQVNSIIDELLANRDMMVNMIDLRSFDDYTYAHSVNVTVLSLFIGISMGLDRKSLNELGLSAILHDIGKVFVAKEIVNKPGKLTAAEFEEMKTHSLKGYEYARDKYRIPIRSYVGILEHHEKWDGTGYPSRLAGKKISEFGRIISVADVYDALISERPYRMALSPSEAMEYVIGNCGIMFDTEIVEVFRRKVAPYPVGTTVMLSSGYTAIVVENYEEYCLRPKVRLLFDPEGKKAEPLELDLHSDKALLSIVVMGIALDQKEIEL